MTFPAGLHVIERPAPDPGAPTVVLVHGSLDRAESFRRVMRRMPDVSMIAYDRRGYQGSRDAGVVDLGGHIADLVDMLMDIRARSHGMLSVIGHSIGGDVVIGAALAEPRCCDSIGAFEPPMPWLGFRRAQPGDDGPREWTPLADDPEVEVERFFSRMVSPSAWARLSEEGRASRRADGPALIADLGSIRGPAPFDVELLSIPVLFGMGGAASQPHHRRGVTWLGSHVPGASTFEVEGAQHGAHLSHPDGFATFIRAVIALGSP
ncbi:MAG TPA: alpha/beta hydrolase [Acidimicrobiales bacterium]|jgi:pimeloyl-ACP methyl ester carboxylesterase|nr:alpha/beta hydrolase [Acidimicrobiales bacterium]